MRPSSASCSHVVPVRPGPTARNWGSLVYCVIPRLRRRAGAGCRIYLMQTALSETNIACMAEQETRKFSCLMLFALAMLVARGAHAQVSASTIIAIPGGESGIGFDDIQFSPQLKSVIIPAAQTGAIYLINPVTLVLQAI